MIRRYSFGNKLKEFGDFVLLLCRIYLFTTQNHTKNYMIWNPNKECMSRDEMSALQGKRLHKIVEYVYHNVPFYRNKLQELDIRPDDIQTIEDINKLPFTTK